MCCIVVLKGMHILMANVYDIINRNTYEDYNTSGLNQAEGVSKLVD